MMQAGTSELGPEDWDPAGWWELNWQDQPWRVPEDRLAHPVAAVSHEEATAYARWAGLRLMTEVEFHRAARGDSDRRYPWGDS